MVPLFDFVANIEGITFAAGILATLILDLGVTALLGKLTRLTVTFADPDFKAGVAQNGDY